MRQRIHLLVGAEEKERYRRLAARAGKSLSEWLRAAAEEKAAGARPGLFLETTHDLRAFFDECDRREVGHEPDWEAHRGAIARSIGRGASES